MKILTRLKEFRQKVYTAGFTKRAHARLNVVDALTVVYAVDTAPEYRPEAETLPIELIY